MRVAYLLNQYPMPSQTFVRREIQALESAGWTVDRYSIRPAGEDLVDAADRSERELTTAVLGQGAPVRVLRAIAFVIVHRPSKLFAALRQAISLGRRSSRGLTVHFAYLAEACVVARWFHLAGTGHVHSHFGTNAPVVALLSRTLGGPPYSFTVHGPEEFDDPVGLCLREKVAGAAFVAVISSFGQSQLFRWCDQRDWTRIHIVRCGLDPRYIDEEPSPTPDTNQVVCIGRLCEQKGQLLLIEAVTKLLAEGCPVDLFLAGEGPMRLPLEAAVARGRVGEHVRISGWIDNAQVRETITASRVLVLASFAEGLPVALMETLALGRAVVTTAIAGIPELVDEQCGWVVPAGSVEALADAIRTALSTPTHVLDEMGAEGRSRVLMRHDAHVEAARLGELFQRSTDQPLDVLSRSHTPT